MNERIRRLRVGLGLSQSEFGERIGLKKAAISLIENGKSDATLQTVKSICREFHIREEWLREGTGEMYEPAAPDDVSAFLQAKGVTGLEADLFKAYFQLPADLRAAVLDAFERYFEEKKAAAPPGGEGNAGEDGVPHDGK